MRFAVFVCLLVCTSLAADSGGRVVHVKNFAIVSPHLMRGAEPGTEGLSELSSAGVKVVIDLRESGSATEFEKQQAEKLGMKYTNMPFAAMAAPSPTQIRTVLDLLAQNTSKTVFVHCRRGKDRTGTVIACYRVQHDGWSNARALDEARSFGMSSMERGMRTFILHFIPLSNAAEPVLLTH